MKRTTIIIFAFLVILSSVPAGANEGLLDVKPGSVMILSLDESVSIIGDANQTRLWFSIEAEDKKGAPVKGLRLAPRLSGNEFFLIIKKDPGTTSSFKNVKITLKVPPDQELKLQKVKGDYSFSNLSGTVSGVFSQGKIRFEKCSGNIKLKIQEGQLSILDHQSVFAPLDINMKSGKAVIEVGTDKPGPGRLVLKGGRVTWKLINRAPITFIGEVKKGLINCNLPLSRKNPNLLRFTSMGGKNIWQVSIDNGVLDLELPEPQDRPKKVSY